MTQDKARLDHLAELRSKFPVGEPIVLIKNRQLVSDLIQIRNAFHQKWINLDDELEESDDPDEDGFSIELENYMDDLDELKESFGIDFDKIENCNVPLANLVSKFSHPEEVISFFDMMIDWFIQSDLDLSSEDYRLLDIKISDRLDTPIVFGYKSGMF